MGENIDTNCMTLTRFMLKEHHEDGLSQLLTSIQSACKAIGAAVCRAGMSNLFGKAGNQNSSVSTIVFCYINFSTFL